MKKALIHGSRICQIVDPGEEFPVAPGLEWHDVPDDTTTEDTWNGSSVVKAASPNLAEIKTSALASIDRAAEAARLRWVTPGEVKQAVYAAKAAEADRLAQDADPDPADYPLLAPEAAARGLSLTEFGAVVRSTRDTWLAVAGQIEASAVTAKAAISAAADAAAVQAILDNLSWPAPPA